ncbi:Sulfite exporter TauE/SafE [Pirellulimonas nuda]|uniref:Probable membrane transporter protein n=1 Tax=Pirellulimonas nuda TaxID=2528009 RepID=A0A518DFX6_9BACT|nr:sulfite exporter TauE/SafE family protein [Pirellulimonas nuda]QDU90332.1 Sulfite exporter TauE/SafE [Pirellulimonas nuda]
MIPLLALLFGGIVGFSLGLTGGGGAILAVPLLVYGLSVDPRQAVGVSLAAVGITSAVGFLGRWRAGQVEVGTGLLFAGAGMLGAPVGSWLSSQIPEPLLLTLFALLMLAVAVRMWRQSAPTRLAPANVTPAGAARTACGRDAAGNLRLNSPCAMLLGAVGVLTGVLSGLFGVGGGFVIVPALVVFSGMAIHRAVATSLMVITLISVSGVASHLMAGREIPIELTSYFVVGGVLGMFAGIGASRYLSGPALQKVFALVIVAVGLFVMVRTAFHL